MFPYPRIGGHEIAGRVAALGPDTQGPKVGTAVVVEPFISCGRCYACRIGKPNCCATLSIIGVHREGGFADYVCAPVDRLCLSPAGLTPLQASFAEPVAIGVQACRRGAVSAEDVVLVLGAGPIGLAIIEVARARGATVYVTDIVADRLAIAERLGAIPLDVGDGLAAKVAVVSRVARGCLSSSKRPAVRLSWNQRRRSSPPAAASLSSGLAPVGSTVTWPALDLTRKEMTIVGSRASANAFSESLALLERGLIRYPEIATTVPLSEAPKAFQALANNPAAFHKAVFVREAP